MRFILCLVAAIGFTCVAAAELSIPRVSPAASVSQTVGTTAITVDYHRPSVRGRTIWGALVPFGELWRLGANNATRITFADAVVVAGTRVVAGSYALFAIPDRDRWTMILNSDADQWGAFSYDETKDVARIEVTPRSAAFHELMELALTPVGEDSVDVRLRWEHLEVSFPIRVEVRRIVWSAIDTALLAAPDDVKTMARAARYAAESGERLEQALVWIDKALTADASIWNMDQKARILWRLGRGGDAVRMMQEALTKAEGSAPQEFLRTRGALLTDWRAIVGE